MCPAAVPTTRTIRRRALMRGATVSAVTNEEPKTGSKRDCRAAHGAVRVAACVAKSPFFHGVEPEVPNAPARWGGNRSAGSERALRRWLRRRSGIFPATGGRLMKARTFLIGTAVALTFVATPALGQQIDLAGMWSASLGNHEELPLRGDPGVEVGEYVGIPLNDAARQHADSWTPTMHSLLEWQGRPHPVTYSMRAPRPDFRMGAVVDPKTERLVAYTITGLFGRADRRIWLDGRPHPSKYAEHQWQGFSSGEWIGGGLKVTTTHIKYSFLHRDRKS